MYKIQKFPWPDRHKLFWTSDLHNFHNPNWPVPIWKERGYDSHEAALEDTKNKINARVGPDDHLFMLGDGFLNAQDGEVLTWLEGIQCQNIHYLFGNHESNMYRIYKQEILQQYGSSDVEVYPLRMKNVIFSGNHMEIRVGKKHIIMNHFPLHSWNKMGHNSQMVSGHQHLTDPTRRPDYPHGLCFDAGWDWKRDVWSFEELVDVMSTKTFLRVDRHGPETT